MSCRNSEAFIWVTLTGPGEVVCASAFNNLIYSAHSWRNPFSWPQCVLRTVHLDPEGPSVVSVSLLFSVPNCYAFQKYKLSLLGLNKVFLFTTKRKACHVQSTRCKSAFCQKLALLCIFISRWLLLPLPSPFLSWLLLTLFPSFGRALVLFEERTESCLRLLPSPPCRCVAMSLPPSFRVTGDGLTCIQIRTWERQLPGLR